MSEDEVQRLWAARRAVEAALHGAGLELNGSGICLIGESLVDITFTLEGVRYELLLRRPDEEPDERPQ